MEWFKRLIERYPASGGVIFLALVVITATATVVTTLTLGASGQ